MGEDIENYSSTVMFRGTPCSCREKAIIINVLPSIFFYPFFSSLHTLLNNKNLRFSRDHFYLWIYKQNFHKDQNPPRRITKKKHEVTRKL